MTCGEGTVAYDCFWWIGFGLVGGGVVGAFFRTRIRGGVPWMLGVEGGALDVRG